MSDGSSRGDFRILISSREILPHLNHNHVADCCGCVCSARRRRLSERSDFLPSPRAYIEGMHIIGSPSEANSSSCMAKTSQDVAIPPSQLEELPDLMPTGLAMKLLFLTLPVPLRHLAKSSEIWVKSCMGLSLHRNSPNKRSLDFDRSPSGPEIAVSV